MNLLPLLGIGFMSLGIATDCWTTLDFMKKEGPEAEGHAIPRNLYKKYGPRGVVTLDIGFGVITVLVFSLFAPILQVFAFVGIGLIWLHAGVRNAWISHSLLNRNKTKSRQ